MAWHLRFQHRVLVGLVTLGALFAQAPGAWAQSDAAANFPEHSVRLMVAYSAGGATDLAARTIAQELGKMWHQSVVVENRPGAGGNIGAVEVAHAKPDGYYLIMVAPAHAINVSLYSQPGYRALEDFEPIGQVSFITNMVVVHPSFPVTSIKELIEAAKQNPGIMYAHGGVGTSEHLSAEYFQLRTGIKLSAVPYRGTAQYVTDLIAGQVKLAFANMPAVLPYVQNGTLRALAVSSPQRSPVLPNVPTIAEASGLSDYGVTVWLGLMAPAGTPKAIVQKINHDVGQVLQIPDVRSKLAGLGMEPAYSSSEDFRKLIASEVKKYAEVIKVAGVKPQ